MSSSDSLSSGSKRASSNSHWRQTRSRNLVSLASFNAMRFLAMKSAWLDAPSASWALAPTDVPAARI